MYDSIIEWYNTYENDVIYATMFGGHCSYDPVIEIEKRDLEINNSRTAFLYMWGWPGPDYNIYAFKDYGKTWAFTLEELK